RTFRSSCSTRGSIRAAPKCRFCRPLPMRKVNRDDFPVKFSFPRQTSVAELCASPYVAIRARVGGEQIMKIAQIAPLMESVPPRLYGGSERIVSYLTDELVRAGHDVTLFASGDSVSSARLVPCVPMALRLDANVRDPIPYYMLMLDRVRELVDEFDILHFHIDQFHFPLFRPHRPRAGATVQGRETPPDSQAAVGRLQEEPAGDVPHPAPQADPECELRRHRLSRHPQPIAQAELPAARQLSRVSRT